jgi:hypothetical protein
MDFREIGNTDLNRFELAQDRVKCEAFMMAAMSLQAP